MTEVSTFPAVATHDRADGSVEVVMLGMSHVFDGPDARDAALRHVHGVAVDPAFNRPVLIETHGTDGNAGQKLIVYPDGQFSTADNRERRRPIAGIHAATADTTEAAEDTHSAVVEEQRTAPPTTASAVDRATIPPPPPADQVKPAPPLARKSFIADEPVMEPAETGWRGVVNRMGGHLQPGQDERSERQDVADVSQHWPGPRTIAVGNPKGSAGKTPVTAVLSAVFARYGGAGVLAWDNNETRGSLAWRTQRANHEATVLDLLPKVDNLLSTSAQVAEMSYYAHHQAKDKYDVLRSDQSVEGDHEVSAADVEAIHRVASRYYRMIVMDSGNNERAANWRAMIERADVLVVPCTNVEDTAEAGARMLEALAARDEHSKKLAENAVVIVSKRAPGKDDNTPRIVGGFQPLVREVVTIPYDKALVTGVIHFDAMKPATQRAWLRAAAAVARGL